jgi:hypothetical protein
MIIGINGKIGSGKDTVGKIIQWLTKPEPDGQYIGFQTYDDYTLEKLSPFKIKKFAGKLKQIASLLTGIPVEKFEDQEFKKLNMNPEWGMTYREFLQKLGTEAMREGLHTNVWVNALFADYTPTHYLIGAFDTKLTDGDPIYPNWIITDMRFPNEMEAVELRKGVTIKVVRPGTSVGTHPSETALDDAYFDHVISNDGTIEDLIEKVRQILTIERII